MLVDAFAEGAANAQFTQLMGERGNVMMSISGDEADDFLRKWQSVTTWLLHDAGATQASPKEFDIPRP